MPKNIRQVFRKNSKKVVLLHSFSNLNAMFGENDFSRLELDLSGCRDNYKYFRGLLKPQTKMLVLVKANAYGHGAVEFAKMMTEAGADYLAVAYPVEGMELREAGIHKPILVLTAGTDFFNEIIDNNLEPSIPNTSALDILCKTLEERDIRNFPIHIKLDTGMSRLGFLVRDGHFDGGVEAIAASCALPHLEAEGIFTHFLHFSAPFSALLQLAFQDGLRKHRNPGQGHILSSCSCG